MLKSSTSLVDFGQVYFPSKTKQPSKSFTLTNNSSSTITLAVQHKVEKEYLGIPIKVSLRDSAKLPVIETLEPKFEIGPNETRTVTASLTSVDETQQQKLTSFFEVCSFVHFVYHPVEPKNVDLGLENKKDDNETETEVLEVKFLAMPCASILYLETSVLDFGACTLAEMYTREVQIWNRSECALQFRLAKGYSSAGAETDDPLELSVVDVESGLPLMLNETVSVTSFSSKRLRVILTPSKVSDGNRFNFTVLNINNTENSMDIEIRYKVGIQPLPESLLSIEEDENLSDPSSVPPSNAEDPDYLFTLGDIFCNHSKVKYFWMRNNSEFEMEVVVERDLETSLQDYLLNEISLSLDDPPGGVGGDEEVPSYAACVEQWKSLEERRQRQRQEKDARAKLLTEKDKESGGPGVKVSLQDATDDETASQTDSISIGDNKGGDSLGPRSQQAMDDQSLDSGTGNNPHKENIVQPTTTDTIITWGKILAQTNTHRGGTGAGKRRTVSSGPHFSNSVSSICGRIWGDERVRAELSGDEWFLGASLQGRNIRMASGVTFQRPFIGPTSDEAKRSRAKSIHNRPPVYKPSNQPTSKAPALSTPIEGTAKEEGGSSTDSLVSASTMQTSKSDFFTVLGSIFPIRAWSDPGTNSAAASPRSTGVQPSFENFTQQPDWVPGAEAATEETGKGDLSLILKPQENRRLCVVVTPSKQYMEDLSAPLDGEPVERVIGISVRGKALELESPEDQLHTQLEQQLSVQLHFRAAYCIIKVSPSLYDLGVCHVGELRTAVFSIRNDSVLPVTVYPFAESGTFGLMEQEVHLKAKQSKDLKIEYVAQSENSEYHNKLFLLNALDISNSQRAEITARNVDTHQVLLHSMFYKLITFNNKRELQLSYDQCLFDMPNLKTFCIKNVYSKPLRVEILLRKSSGIRLFLVKHPEKPQDGQQNLVNSIAAEASHQQESIRQQESTGTGADRQKGTKGPGESFSSVPFSETQEYAPQGRLEYFEDLKWDDEQSHAQHNNVSRREFGFRLGLEDEFSFVKSTSKRKASVNGGSNDADGGTTSELLDALDVPESVSNWKAVGVVNQSRLLQLQDPLPTDKDQASGGPGSKSSRKELSKSFHFVSNSEKLSRSVDRGTSIYSAYTDKTSGNSLRAIRSPSVHVDLGELVTQMDRGGFPFLDIDKLVHGDEDDHRDFGELHDTGGSRSELGRLGQSNEDQEDSDAQALALQDRGIRGLDSGSVGMGGAAGRRVDMRGGSTNVVEMRVKRIQQMFSDLKKVMSGETPSELLYPLALSSCEVEAAEKEPEEEVECRNRMDSRAVDARLSLHFSSAWDVCTEVDIPVDQSFIFAAVFVPAFDSSGHSGEDACNQVSINEYLYIKLPGISSAEMEDALAVNRHVKQKDTDGATDVTRITSHNTADIDRALVQSNDEMRPRVLPIRAVKVVRSEMVVIQKNISFGRTLVGDSSSRVVTVVNKSSISCVYAISKSGSISSSFLHVPGGRKGIIAPFSSKSIEFVFKPTLPGSFEETLRMQNVLNPHNTESIIIKAKVSKAESFILFPHEKVPAVPPAPMASAVDSTPENSLVLSGEQMLSLRTPAEEKKIPGMKSGGNDPITFLGSVAVGEQCEVELSFRIRNLTSKTRQFIVDATHLNAVTLLEPTLNTPRGRPIEADDTLSMATPPMPLAKRPVKVDSPRETNSFLPFPFEPIPEILQSVLSIRCQFCSELFTSGKGAEDGRLDSMLSEEEKKALEDSLEHYQQKLKIAIRKEKPDKIEKYQKKINNVISALTGNKQADSKTEDLIKSPIKGIASPDKLSAEAEEPGVDPTKKEKKSKEGESEDPRGKTHPSEQTDLTYHFHLEAEQERVVSVKIAFFPGASFRPWKGTLPFQGHFRVFEGRNEDLIKAVRFSALVFSSRATLITVPSSPLQGSRSLLPAPAKSTPLLIRAQSGERVDALVETGAEQTGQSFLLTLAPWSAFPTREVYPRHRNLPNDMLQMCIKLVRASKDRVMYGAISVTSLVEEAGDIQLSVASVLNVKPSSDYVTYNADLHGSLSFGVVTVATAATASAIEQEASVLGSDPHLHPQRSRIAYTERTITAPIAASAKLDFVIQWRPQVEIQQKPNDQPMRILGGVNVQFLRSSGTGGEGERSVQCVPFICVLEHKSSFKLEKFYSFEDVAVGSYRMCQVQILNISETEELHYFVTSEEVPEQYKSIGRIQFISGQTGVIHPNSSKHLVLLFSATSPGKFEQKLWIRNMRDGFDQKRVAVQATVTVTQAKFVLFPDLEYSTEGVRRYQPIDLGHIQIQTSHELTALVPRLAAVTVPLKSYKLKVQNVSSKFLTVTAVSNLRSQCFIYADEACTQLAVNCPVPQHEITLLFVVIRPVLPSRHTASGSAWSSTAIETKGGSRELVGGIRLLFYVDETDPASALLNAADGVHPTPPVSPTPGSPKCESPQDVVVASSAPQMSRKLFETALSFKAKVGKSKLVMSSYAPNALRVVLKNEGFFRTGPDSTVFRFIPGSFEIKNTSLGFSLQYLHLALNDACVGSLPWDGVDYQELIKTTEDDEVETPRILLLDETTGDLATGESRNVNFVLRCSGDTAGLALCYLRMWNLSTSETAELSFPIVFASGRVIEVYDDRDFNEDMRKQEERMMEVRPMGGYGQTESCCNVHTVQCSSPICLLIPKKVEVPADSLANRQKTIEVPEKILAGREKKPETDFQQKFQVSQANRSEIAGWTIRNNTERPVTVTPISDLPIQVLISSLPEVPRKAASGWSQEDQESYSSKIPMKVSNWCKNLLCCGSAFTLSAGESARVRVFAKRGAELEVHQIKALGGSKVVGSGALVYLEGVVALLETAHTLKSIFDPTDIKTATQPVTVGDGDSTEADSTTSVDVLPIISVTKVKCSLVLPILRVPRRVLNLGRLRCGYRKQCTIAIDNISEVTVPCSIDNMPSWLTADTNSYSALTLDPTTNTYISTTNSDGFSIETDQLAFYAGPVTPLDPTHSAVNLHGTFEDDVNQMFSPDSAVDAPSAVGKEKRAKDSLGARKLRWWLEEGTGKQGLSRSQADQEIPAEGVEMDEASVESVAEGEMGSIDTAALEEEELYLGQSSLEVHHGVFQKTLEMMSEAGVASDEDGTPPFLRSDRRNYHIPPFTRLLLQLSVASPYIDSQKLEQTLKIKNLSTSGINVEGEVSGETRRSGEQSVYVSEIKELSTLLEVDATRAISLIAAVDEPLVRSRDRFLTTTHDQRSASTLDSVGRGLASYFRLIGDPFLIPPPVVVTQVERAADSPFHPITTLTNKANSTCRFSMKNCLDQNVSVTTQVFLNPQLADLMDLSLKFQQSNDDSVVLFPEELSEVKIWVQPKVSGRVQSSLTFTQFEIEDVDVHALDAGDHRPQGSPESSRNVPDTGIALTSQNEGGPSRGKTGEKETGGRPGRLERSSSEVSNRIGPLLFGTVRLTPLLGTAQRGSVDSSTGNGTGPVETNSPKEMDSAKEGQQENKVEVEVEKEDMKERKGKLIVGEQHTAQQDIIYLDIAGYLVLHHTASMLNIKALSQLTETGGPGPHSISSIVGAAAAPETTAPKPRVVRSADELLVFKAGREDPVASPEPPRELNGTPLVPSEVEGGNGGASPFLVLKNEPISFLLVNPSPVAPLNFSILSASYRHPSMRLQLPMPVSSIHSISPTHLFDTVTPFASPNRGSIPPNTSLEISLQLLPGRVAEALKAAATLTPDIPDQVMRNRKPIAPTETSQAKGTDAAVEGDSTTVKVDATKPAPQVRPVPESVPGALGGPFTVACMPLEVVDEDWPAHPPQKIFTYLTSDTALPTMQTQPLNNSVRTLNSVRSSVESTVSKLLPPLPVISSEASVTSSQNTSLRSSPDFLSVSDRANSGTGADEMTPVLLLDDSNVDAANTERSMTLILESVSSIRLRGVTPSDASADRYTISLGQQGQRRDAVEWLVTLENKSQDTAIYKVTTSNISTSEDECKASSVEWITVGQTGGTIEPRGSSSMMLYIHRSVVGSFSGVVTVEHALEPHSRQEIAVSLEVVPEPKRPSAVNKQLTHVQQA